MKRILSIDITRGIVMIIMALDHVRDLMHVSSIAQSPTDLSTTTPILFFTRWITYLCAPIFVFLAGSSAYLAFLKRNDLLQSKEFLLKRGIWLIVLEFTMVNFGLFFDAGFHLLLFEVIAAIGVGFIILSFLLSISPKTILVVGLIIVFGHDLFHLVTLVQGSLASKIVSPFFTLTALPLFENHVLVMAYPPIPWLGIMLIGFATGQLFELQEDKRKRIFFYLGSVTLVFFIVLRAINVYGDPSTWSSQKTCIDTFLSFMNVSKYPPSLLFCLVTLGLMFFILAMAEQLKNKFTKVAQVYGNTPLFYFVVHFFIVHSLLLVILFVQGFHWKDLSFASGSFGRPKGLESGVPLWAVYMIWILVVGVLYKPCKWFGQYKSTHKQWWLRYI